MRLGGQYINPVHDMKDECKLQSLLISNDSCSADVTCPLAHGPNLRRLKPQRTSH